MKDVFYNRTANDTPPLNHTDSNGKDSTAFSDINKTEILNEYFWSNSKFQTPVNPYQMFLYCSESLADIVIEESEVIDIISVLPINKDIGPDCIGR